MNPLIQSIPDRPGLTARAADALRLLVPSGSEVPC